MLRNGWLVARITRRWTDAIDVMGLELVADHGAGLPRFSAGDFIDVLAPNGMVRPYSICNSPADSNRYVLAVLLEREGQGGSAALHAQCRAGGQLWIRPPRNEFALELCAVHSVFLAGGIGVTPLVSMAEALWQRGAPFELHYSAATPSHAACRQFLERRPYAGSLRWYWTQSGRRMDFDAVLRRAPHGSEVYACGPSGFLQSAALAVSRTRAMAKPLRTELFHAGPSARVS